VETLEF